MKHYFILITFLTILFSCEKKNNQGSQLNVKNKFNLTFEERINLKIDPQAYIISFVSFKNSFFYVTISDDELAYYFKNKQFKKYSYSYLRENLIFENKDINYNIISSDSLLISTGHNFYLIINDSTINKFEIDKSESIVNLKHKIFYKAKNKKIIFSIGIPNYGYDEIIYQPYLACYSLETQKTMFKFGSLPKENVILLKNNMIYDIYNIYPKSCFNDSISVLSFPLNDSLYIYNNKNGKLLNRVFAKSRYLKFISPPQNPSIQILKNYLIQKGFYSNILYDPYNNLYYRIVRLNQPLKNKFNYLNDAKSCEFSVMCFDHEFKILGESIIKSETYDLMNIQIVPSKGLGLLPLREDSSSTNNYIDIYKFKKI